MSRAKKGLIWGLVLPPLVAAAVFGYRAYGTHQDLEAWKTFQESARAKGDDLGLEAWLPPPVPDADNLAMHPWFAGFFSGDSSPQAAVVADLQIWSALGIEDYTEHEEGTSWFDGKPEASARVLAAANKHAADFAAIHEAAARPGCQLKLDFSHGYESGFTSWPDLGNLAEMLQVHADAALASGDEAAAVADLETMLRLANHLRSQNMLLTQVTGAGFEAKAIGVIETGALKAAFSPESKQRLRAARRSRKLEEELPRIWRMERGMFLRMAGHLVPKTPPESFREKMAAFLYQRDRMIAANSLFFCELLDPALSGPPTLQVWQDFDTRLRTVSEELRPGDPNAVAKAGLRLTGGIIEGMQLQEEDIDRVFKLLNP